MASLILFFSCSPKSSLSSSSDAGKRGKKLNTRQYLHIFIHLPELFIFTFFFSTYFWPVYYIRTFVHAQFIYLHVKGREKKVNFGKYGSVLRKANDQKYFGGSLFGKIYGTFLPWKKMRAHIDSESLHSLYLIIIITCRIQCLYVSLTCDSFVSILK